MRAFPLHSRFWQAYVLRAALAIAALCVLLLPQALCAQQFVVTLDPARSKIAFTLGATLHTVHGSFKVKSGLLRFDAATGDASGAIVVDAASGETGENARDKKMHGEILESQKYPEIIFTPRRVQGSVAPQGVSQVQVAGVFRIHGRDHNITVPLAVTRASGGKLTASAHFVVPYVEWGLKDPSTFFLRVDKKVDVAVNVTGRMTSESPAH